MLSSALLCSLLCMQTRMVRIVLSYSVISGNSFTQYNLHTLIRSLETTKATQISEEKLRYKTAWIYFLNLLIFFRVEKRLD